MFENMPPLFYQNLISKENYKILVNQGGTYSAKTYNINIIVFLECIRTPNTRATVTGQSIPNLKRGALRDMQNMLKDDRYKILAESLVSYNKTDRTFFFKNGSIIEFTIFTSEQDAKNGKRDLLFINEANGVDWMIAQHLILKTERNVFIDYNPTAAFWCHDHITIRKDACLIISDHRANRFISQEIHDEIEGHPDPEWRKVYARGLTGNITGIVFPNWKPINNDEWKEEVSQIFWGVDYGYTNDPTAIVKCYFINKYELVLEEIMYTPSSDDKFIFDVLIANDYHSSQQVYADHDKVTNTLLRRRGISINNAWKLERENAINKIRGIQCWYTPKSTNIHFERSRYVFKKTKDFLTSIPDESGANHLMHASIYAIYTHFLRNNLFL